MATDAVPASDPAIAPGLDAAALRGTVAAGAPGVTSTRPYAPSWLDRLVAWLEGLPGPTWLAYLGITAVAVGLSVVEPLLQGRTDPLHLAGQAFWGVAVPFTLWLFHHLSEVAGDAFDAFRPALTAPEAEAADLRYRITVTPARPALVILVGSALVTPLYYIADPAASGVVGNSPIGMVLRYLSETFFGALLLVLMFQSFRQLRAVGRIHGSATRVDLFRPAPLYAFSVLTSRTAIVIALIFVVPTLVAVGQTNAAGSGLLIVLPWVGVGIAAAAIVFVLPLRGMQRRILAEKRRLQTEVGLRIERTMEAIHDRIDAGDPAAAGAMKDTLDALIAERDLVEKLPTLPWRPGTLGAVVSAIAVPLGLFVVTRVLERFI